MTRDGIMLTLSIVLGVGEFLTGFTNTTLHFLVVMLVLTWFNQTVE